MIKMDDLEKIFSELISEIRCLERQKELSIDQEDILINAISWLKNHQHPEGYWGYESVADTGLVLLSMVIFGVTESSWKISDKYDGGIDLAITWLKSKRNLENWSNNLWDTSICAQALYKLGIRDEWLIRIFDWIKTKLYTEYESFSPHHLAQAANAILETDFNIDKERIIERIIKSLNRHVETTEGEQIIIDPYIAGQVYDTLIKLDYNFSNDLMVSLEDNLRQCLTKVKQGGLSESSFQDVMMAFMGLANLTSGDETLINEILVEIFKRPDRLKEDGSWYHDAKKTAFALLGLSRIINVRRIEEFPYKIYQIIMKYQELASELMRMKNEQTSSTIKNLERSYFWLILCFAITFSSYVLIAMQIENILVELSIGTLLTILLPLALGKLYASIIKKGYLNTDE